MSDKFIVGNWMMIGGFSIKIHCEVRAMVINKSLTLDLNTPTWLPLAQLNLSLHAWIM